MLFRTATPVLRCNLPPCTLLHLLQDEVGVRLTQVDPGAADWRAMNILTLYYCRPQYL